MATEDNAPTDAELLLTDTIDAGEGDDSILAGEPLDEIEYPETLDDEADATQETPLIRQLRERDKERTRQLREQNAEIERLRNRKPVARTKKPDLWDEAEGDQDKYDVLYDAWKENERAADEAESAPADPRRNEQAQAWQSDLQAYKAKAAALAKPDFQAAEDAVVAALSDPQQNTIVMAAKDPARFIYALGRSPIRLAQLAEITNPIKLAAEVARIEGARVMTRKPPANIDEPVKGHARLSTAPANAQEDKLLAEAERTGDLTKLRAYRREQRSKAA